MIDKKRIRALSGALLHAHHENVVFAIEPALYLEGVDEAYWVQEVVLRGIDPRRPKAWKVSPPRDDAEPLSSPTPFKAMKVSPADFPGANRVLGVEAEIAFRFGSAPKVKGKNLEEAFVLIELCETRYLNFEDAPPLCRLADLQSHGGFALGSGTRDWRAIDFSKQAVELLVNGNSALARTGSHPSGSPFALAEWAATHCVARGMPLAAGDIVTTGSWTGLTPVAPGDEVVARFDGIGESTLRMLS